MTRSRAAAIMTGVFLLGAITGALGMGAFVRHRFAWGGPRLEAAAESRAVNRLSRRLGLDADQRRALEEIAHRTRIRLEAVRDETIPRVQEILDDAAAELKPHLRPDQQQELDRIAAEGRDRWRRFSPER